MDTVSNWDIRDVPLRLREYKVLTEPNPVTGEIKQVTEIMGRVQQEVIQTKSDQIRNALIDLGWTPPATDAAPASKLPEEFVNQYLPGAEELWFFGRKAVELPLKDLLAALHYVCEKEFRRTKRGTGQTPSVQPEVSDPDDQGGVQSSERPGGVSLESLLEQARNLAGSKEES